MLAYRYTFVHSGDSTQLTYLRSRYYSSGTGRFLTRDTWGGNIGQPLTHNRWNYENSNPINYIDPSGYSPNCANKGTCGPDVTDWFRKEMSDHYDYGIEIRNKVMRMKALAVAVTAMTPCTDIFTFLSLVAIEAPFNQIVREFNIPKTNVPIGIVPMVTPGFANAVIDVLGRLEFGLYGLAVDYANITHKTNSTSCSTGTCASAQRGDDSHQIISLCNRCRDVSDLGNMMFGLGGAARGYSWPFVVGSAVLFNQLSGDSTSWTADGGGAFPGWVIGVGQLYRTNPVGFCGATYIPIGYDSVSQTQGCQACNGTTIYGHPNVSSITRVSGSSPDYNTIKELQGKTNTMVDKIFIWLLRQAAGLYF